MGSPGRSPTVRRTELRAAALAAVIALTASSGCGSGDSGEEAKAEASGANAVVDVSGTEPVGDGATPVGEMTAGSVAQLVECRDWNGATPEQRLATIEDVRSQINLGDSGIEMPALTDEEAGELFDDACKPSWAAGFRLYKLYARAAGFVSLNRVLDE
jgi:hypothetical protein